MNHMDPFRVPSGKGYGQYMGLNEYLETMNREGWYVVDCQSDNQGHVVVMRLFKPEGSVDKPAWM